MRIVNTISTLETMEVLAPVWRELLVSSASGSVFQTPEWCIEWWRAFGGGSLRVMTTRDGGGISAVAPLMVRGAGDSLTATLVMLGTGNSDELDVIASDIAPASDIADDAMALALDNRWSIDWRRLPATSSLLRNSDAASIVEELPCPMMVLPPTAADLERALGSDLLHRLEYGHRRLARDGTVHYEWLHGSAIDRGLDDLFELHAARWRRKGETGVLRDDSVQRFHRSVAGRLDAKGELRLVRMSVGGSTIAVYYGFEFCRRGFFYIGGFDPSRSAASPGSQLLREVLRRAIDDGVESFDFLAGQEHYKYEWGAIDRPFFARVAAAGAPVAWA